MTSKISGQWEHIWYGYKRTFYGFEKPQFCIQSKNVVTISLCRFYNRLSNTTMIKENIRSSGENSEIFEFIPGGYAPISKEEATLS